MVIVLCAPTSSQHHRVLGSLAMQKARKYLLLCSHRCLPLWPLNNKKHIQNLRSLACKVVPPSPLPPPHSLCCVPKIAHHRWLILAPICLLHHAAQQGLIPYVCLLDLGRHFHVLVLVFRSFRLGLKHWSLGPTAVGAVSLPKSLSENE